MKNHHRHKGGYITLVIFLIIVLITVFIILKQYEYFGFSHLKTGTATTTTNGESGASGSMTPIESAQNAKRLIEARNQNNFNELK